MNISQETHKKINNLSRNQIQAILENFGFACYDSESTDDLRSALVENIIDGTIEESVVDDLL
jgi:hypothetical protein